MAENQTLPQLTTVSSLASSDLLYLVRTSTLDRAIAWSDVVTTLSSSYQPLDSALTSFSSLISNVYAASVSWTPGTIAANGGVVANAFSIAGVAANDIAIVSIPLAMSTGLILQARAGSGVVDLFITNITAFPSTETALTFKIAVFRLA